MADETELTDVNDSEDEWEYPETASAPGAFMQFMVTLGSLALSALAGVMFAMLAERILQRYSE